MLNNKISQSNSGISQTLSSSAASSTASPNSSGISTAGLLKGQLIKGEITDIRSNEVSVKMEDGKILTGKLEDSSSLSMGDKVVLRVEDLSLKSLTLKIIANTDFTNQDNTIEKALEAAGLSKNEKNYAIVNELLKQQMSIDKNSISLIIRQSLGFKDCSLQTLVLLNKLNLPVTENNVKQFEAYTSFENSMMEDLKSLADTVAGYFSGDDSLPDSEYVNLSKGLLPFLYGNETGSAVTKDTLLNLLSAENENTNSLTPNSFSLNNMATLSGTETLNNTLTLNSVLSSGELFNLAEMIESDSSFKAFFSEEQLAALRNGSADLKQTAQTLNLIINQMDASAALSAENTDFSNKVKQLMTSETAQLVLSAANESFTDKEIGSYLNKADRLQLLNSLIQSGQNSNTAKEFETMKGQITSGSATTADLLKLIHGNLGEASAEASKSLLTSDAFKSLIKEQLLSNWSIPPEDIGKGQDINKHYESLLEQLNNIKDYTAQTGSAAGAAIQEQVGHLNENINFMNNMNNLFTYIQIPLKMQNQYTDSQLYVYSKKKPGRSAEDGISVLLHLNMDHLGTLDVFVELKNNNLSSKFYLEDTDIVTLFSSHINQLGTILEAKGYTFHSEILPREKKVNIVQDFLDQEVESVGLTRYKFDLRA